MPMFCPVYSARTNRKCIASYAENGTVHYPCIIAQSQSVWEMAAPSTVYDDLDEFNLYNNSYSYSFDYYSNASDHYNTSLDYCSSVTYLDDPGIQLSGNLTFVAGLPRCLPVGLDYSTTIYYGCVLHGELQ